MRQTARPGPRGRLLHVRDHRPETRNGGRSGSWPDVPKFPDRGFTSCRDARCRCPVNDSFRGLDREFAHREVQLRTFYQGSADCQICRPGLGKVSRRSLSMPCRPFSRGTDRDELGQIRPYSAQLRPTFSPNRANLVRARQNVALNAERGTPLHNEARLRRLRYATEDILVLLRCAPEPSVCSSARCGTELEVCTRRPLVGGLHIISHQ